MPRPKATAPPAASRRRGGPPPQLQPGGGKSAGPDSFEYGLVPLQYSVADDIGTDGLLFGPDQYQLRLHTNGLGGGLPFSWPMEQYQAVGISNTVDYQGGGAQTMKQPSPSILSEDPSVGYSTASSVSSYSNCTTLSPVNTDFPSCTDGQAAPSAWSRGPSPLRHMTAVGSTLESDFADLSHTQPSTEQVLGPGPLGNATSAEEREPQEHVMTVYGHTCSWASCRATNFTTREGLNWHVKADHLLICPVLGCCEVDFQSTKMLDSHIRAAHPQVEAGSMSSQANQTSKVTQTIQPSLPSIPATPPDEDGVATPKASLPKWDAVNDPAMKMALSVATSKRKCREQLRVVMEKRVKRFAGTPRSVGTPRSADSPQDLVRSRTPKLIESASFPLVWEHGVLPFLAEFVPKWCGPGHVISVARGKNPNARRICIMTKKKLSRARKLYIAAHVRDLLPSTYRHSASFCFSSGQVDRLVWARGLGKDMPDEICSPRNPFCYISPCMGDSIGICVNDAEVESTSTLGPCLTIGRGSYWLANFHPFVDTFQTRDMIRVEHPSPRDRDHCLEEGHDALLSEDTNFRLGSLTAASGFDLKTTRLSHDLYWEDNDKEPPLVVTDWTLISSQVKQANMLRKFPATAPRLSKEVPVTSTSPVVPGANVLSTGRTSGHQRGQVCEIPAYVSGDEEGNGTGRATREWFIEEPYPCDNEDAWIRGGIGVEGDSGAVIVDADTNALLGQLWGRNKYFGSGPRHTFFTPINDILDDIQEKCGEQSRPQLPQYRDESERWAVYPLCRPCFDLSTYLDSRRSSRESLRSMLGHNESVGTFGDDQDLTSIDVSEMATPKDHSHWLRHAGPEEAGMSFTSIVSPTPLTSFSSFNHAMESPRVADMRSPYAIHLDTDDLYDAEYAAPDAATGKRPALSMTRSSSNGDNKRRKVS